jgi:hypothetical protein
MSTGQEMAGAPVSLTVIVNEHEACVLSAASSAKYVMVVSVPVV